MHALKQNTRVQKKIRFVKSFIKKINHHPPQEKIDQLKRLLGEGKYSIVFKNAESIIQNYPNSFIIWNLLGVAAYEIQKFDYAIMSYKKSISINQIMNMLTII